MQLCMPCNDKMRSNNKGERERERVCVWIGIKIISLLMVRVIIWRRIALHMVCFWNILKKKNNNNIKNNNKNRIKTFKE